LRKPLNLKSIGYTNTILQRLVFNILFKIQLNTKCNLWRNISSCITMRGASKYSKSSDVN